MTRVPVLRRTAVPAFLLSTILLIPPYEARAEDPASAGVLWETSSQMSMAGMPLPMPAQKLKVCAKADAVEPPGSANDERGCVNSDFQRDGQTVSWTSVCAGPPEMTGQGTITYSPDGDAYEGSLNYATADGNVAIALTGKRLPETCANPR
jgi:hypothetical protein